MSHEHGQFIDVKAMLGELEADGARVEVDGWKPRLVGNRPPVDRVVALHNARLAVLYHLVSTAPHRCATCEGVATYQSGGEWFCHDHTPIDDGRYELWQASARRHRLQQQRTSLADFTGPMVDLQRERLEEQITRISADIEAIEAQIAAQES